MEEDPSTAQCPEAADADASGNRGACPALKSWMSVRHCFSESQTSRDPCQAEKIARNTAELIGLGRDLRDEEITVLEGWAGDLYGIPVQSTLDAIRLSGRLEGMIIDPVYEGKSLAGLIDLVRNGDIPKDSNVLYAHLGGQPALNAYSGVFQ